MKKTNHLFFITLLFIVHTSRAQYNYPATKQIPVTDDYFGTKITDNYRWLEDLSNTDVQAWFKAQSDFSYTIIGKIKGSDTLFNRMKQIQNMGGDGFRKIKERGNSYFYIKTKKNEATGKLYYRTEPNGEEVLLFDPQAFKAGTELSNYKINYDGTQVAIMLAQGGTDICDVRILNVADKKMLPDVLTPIWSEFEFEFTADNKALTYTKLSSSDMLSDDLLKDSEARLHIIGTDMSKDRIVGSRKNDPQLHILTEQFPEITFSIDHKFVFLRIGSAKKEYIVYYAPIASFDDEKINWKPLINYNDDVIAYAASGDQLFFLSHKNASNFKIGVVDLKDPNINNAKIVVPESSKVIDEICETKNYIFYTLNDGINQDIYKIDIKTLAATKLPLPQGQNWCRSMNAKENDKLVTFNNSWITPFTISEYDVKNNLPLKNKWLNVSGTYPDYNKQFEVKEIEIKSYDGTLVPLSIVYPKNIKLDGTTPCYISGYGSYGFNIPPDFIGGSIAFLEQGCIMAFAHVRGGGEKGEAWHQSGMKETKPNTWKDFIACAEYLVKEKYTSPQKLIGSGMSAGGLLIGRAITERPDLFAVGIDEVGETNALRSEITPNGPNQIPEIGTLKNEKDTKGIIEMDAQSKVKKGVKYPAVLIRCGMNDPRIIPWTPGKFAAVLQNSTASNKPVLLYVNYNNGHFTRDLDITFREQADMFAFALWQVGHKKFQP